VLYSSDNKFKKLVEGVFTRTLIFICDQGQKIFVLLQMRHDTKITDCGNKHLHDKISLAPLWASYFWLSENTYVQYRAGICDPLWYNIDWYNAIDKWYIETLSVLLTTQCQRDQTFCEKSDQFCSNIAQTGASVYKNFPKNLGSLRLKVTQTWILFRWILGDIFQKKTATFRPIWSLWLWATHLRQKLLQSWTRSRRCRHV
jgi:hypothetical protein